MDRTLRWFLSGAAIAFLVDIVILATLGTESDRAKKAWLIANFPSLPCVVACAMVVPPPMGEAETTIIDYAMLGVSLLTSCLVWGGIGAAVAAMTEPEGDVTPPGKPGEKG